jgi:hypothetical protein
MDVGVFWQLIDEARAKAGQKSVGREVARMLDARSEEENAAFGAILATYMSALRREDLWAAAYAIRGGMSDDSFDYFRGWLVGRGEAVMLAAVRDPESLADVAADVDPRDEYMLQSIVYGDRKRELVADWPKDRVASGVKWTDEFYRDTYPRLYARFIAKDK